MAVNVHQPSPPNDHITPKDIEEVIGTVSQRNKNVWNARWQRMQGIVTPWESDLSMYDDPTRYKQPIYIDVHPLLMSYDRKVKVVEGFLQLGFIPTEARGTFVRSPIEAKRVWESKRAARKRRKTNLQTSQPTSRQTALRPSQSPYSRQQRLSAQILRLAAGCQAPGPQANMDVLQAGMIERAGGIVPMDDRESSETASITHTGSEASSYYEAHLSYLENRVQELKSQIKELQANIPRGGPQPENPVPRIIGSPLVACCDGQSVVRVEVTHLDPDLAPYGVVCDNMESVECLVIHGKLLEFTAPPHPKGCVPLTVMCGTPPRRYCRSVWLEYKTKEEIFLMSKRVSNTRQQSKDRISNENSRRHSGGSTLSSSPCHSNAIVTSTKPSQPSHPATSTRSSATNSQIHVLYTSQALTLQPSVSTPQATTSSLASTRASPAQERAFRRHKEVVLATSPQGFSSIGPNPASPQMGPTSPSIPHTDTGLNSSPIGVSSTGGSRASVTSRPEDEDVQGFTADRRKEEFDELYCMLDDGDPNPDTTSTYSKPTSYSSDSDSGKSASMNNDDADSLFRGQGSVASIPSVSSRCTTLSRASSVQKRVMDSLRSLAIHPNSASPTPNSQAEGPAPAAPLAHTPAHVPPSGAPPAAALAPTQEGVQGGGSTTRQPPHAEPHTMPDTTPITPSASVGLDDSKIPLTRNVLEWHNEGTCSLSPQASATPQWKRPMDIPPHPTHLQGTSVVGNPLASPASSLSSKGAIAANQRFTSTLQTRSSEPPSPVGIATPPVATPLKADPNSTVGSSPINYLEDSDMSTHLAYTPSHPHSHPHSHRYADVQNSIQATQPQPHGLSPQPHGLSPQPHGLSPIHSRVPPSTSQLHFPFSKTFPHFNMSYSQPLHTTTNQSQQLMYNMPQDLSLRSRFQSGLPTHTFTSPSASPPVSTSPNTFLPSHVLSSSSHAIQSRASPTSRPKRDRPSDSEGEGMYEE